MKVNWGTGVIIAFIAFISFIMYFVIIMSANEEFEHDLVTEEYYKDELAFQKQINKEQKAKNKGYLQVISKTKKGLVVSFPEIIPSSEVSGSLFFYRPSNKKLDFEMPISLSNSSLIIANKYLLEGRWNIVINWKYKKEEYLNKFEITF